MHFLHKLDCQQVRSTPCRQWQGRFLKRHWLCTWSISKCYSEEKQFHNDFQKHFILICISKFEHIWALQWPKEKNFFHKAHYMGSFNQKRETWLRHPGLLYHHWSALCSYFSNKAQVNICSTIFIIFFQKKLQTSKFLKTMTYEEKKEKYWRKLFVINTCISSTAKYYLEVQF